MSNTYFYHFPVKSDPGRALRSFHRASVKAEQEQMDYCRKVGAKSFLENTQHFTGGVVGVFFADPAKVNRNIWRIEGHDKDSYEPIFVPNTIDRYGQQPLQPDQAIPKSNAHRIYAPKPATDQDGHRYAQYVDIIPAATAPSGSPAGKAPVPLASPRGKATVPSGSPAGKIPKSDCARAVQAELWRLKLPTTSFATLFRILGFDYSCDYGTAATVKHESTTPTFFIYGDRYYVAMSHPSRHDCFTAIEQADYHQAMLAAKQAQRDKDFAYKAKHQK